MSHQHVLVISHDVVASRMAGPGIRYRELARVLSQTCQVTLAVPDQPGLGDQPFDGAQDRSFHVWPYRRDSWPSLASIANRADAIVACGDSLADFPALAELRTPLVIDGYDPHTLETLALWSIESLAVQTARHDARLAILRRQCQAGDFFLCASERQRDWWLGLLEQEGRINPQTYGEDPSLRRLVNVVPYGLPSEPPRAARPVLRGIWPGVGPEDRIVLWGGGLWEWLDPLTALRAVRRLADEGLALRLVFPGTRHPNPGMTDMPMRARTVALAEELGLTGRYAFFGDWVPYEDWPGVLLEADVGLSLHPDTVEARLAYRSRVLDYVWAGLPMVVTRGDAAADLVSGYDLGLVVDYDDDVGVAEAIARLLDEGRGEASKIRRRCFGTARQDLTWERAAEPLVAFCREPRRAPDRSPLGIGQSSVETRPMGTSGRIKEEPRASVIVLTWNGGDYIEACLASILAQDYGKFEVIVVDNGSSDGTPEFVSERFPEVRLIRNERNLGFAAGNNVGLQAAGGDLLVLLNQDTRVHPGWLAALVQAFDDEAVGIAGCKLLYPGGTIQHAGAYLYGPRGESDHLGRHAPDPSIVPRAGEGRFDQMADVEFVTAAALAIRREALDEIGLLDEGFGPAYYEDTDWCYRARAAGFRVVYWPEAAVTHYESTTTTAVSHERKYALHQGRLRFLFKHRSLDRLLQEFGPAESAWVAAMDRSEELMAARRAYLNTILALPGIVAFRRGGEGEADALLNLLVDLRSAALTSLRALAAGDGLPGPSAQRAYGGAECEQGRLLDNLREHQTIREQPFTSQIPMLGRLIVAFRNLWNSVAAKWYVRPQFHQQNLFNARVVSYLQLLQQQVTEQERLLAEQEYLLQGQFRDVAENMRELTALAERLAEMTARASNPRKIGSTRQRSSE